MSDAKTDSDDMNWAAPRENEAEREQSEERKKQCVGKATAAGQNTPAKEQGLKRAKPGNDEPVTSSKAGKSSTTLAQRTDPATDAGAKGELFKKDEAEKPPVYFREQPLPGDPHFFRNITSLKQGGAGWSPSLLVFDDTPDTLKLAGADGKWFLGAGWPANSNAFFNKYGSMQANGTVERKLLTAIQKWRADGSQPGSVYATCDPAPADFKPGRPSAYHSPHDSRPAYPKKPVVAP